MWVWGAVVVALALAIGLSWWLRPGDALKNESVQSAPSAPVTAAVERATLTSQVRLNAQLTYGEVIPLAPAGGTITGLPVPATTVYTGQRVYEVNGRPVVLFRGPRPFWRELSADVDDGEDVRQLQQNLADLGFYRGVVDGSFDGLTRQAVREWQRSLGADPTGVFSPSDVVVTHAAGIRISQITARLGEAGTSPATYTDTTLRAVARLTAAQARELRPETAVTVTLPDGVTIDTTLASVDPGGQPAAQKDETTPPTATIEFADQEQVAAAGPVAVRVVISAPEEQTVTLVVPVTALLATADGAYAVELWDGERVTRTPVEVGLVADARVQVLRSGKEIDGGTGPVLKTGDLVVLAR